MSREKHEAYEIDLSHIPEYARSAAQKALVKIRNLEKAGKFKAGLYYVVFVDLVGSAVASTKIGPDENAKRIKNFIKFTTTAWKAISPRNTVLFVREIGDGVLFIFSNFEDILNWVRKLDEYCKRYNKSRKVAGKPAVYKLSFKRVVHLGEVHYLDSKSPIALAVNQLFSIEKKISGEVFVVTDPVREVILANINSGQLSARMAMKVRFPGHKSRRPLWLISIESLKS